MLDLLASTLLKGGGRGGGAGGGPALTAPPESLQRMGGLFPGESATEVSAKGMPTTAANGRLNKYMCAGVQGFTSPLSC